MSFADHQIISTDGQPLSPEVKHKTSSIVVPLEWNLVKKEESPELVYPQNLAWENPDDIDPNDTTLTLSLILELPV